jgi:hypothetical protein
MSNIDWDYVREHGQQFRVHGNGFVQVDLPLDRRLHVWGHPRIPRQAESTPIHDHRFSFTSEVLRGRLVNVRIRLDEKSLRADHEVCVPKTRSGEDTILVKTGVFGMVKVEETEWLRPGDVYAMTIGELHEIYVNQTTVTLMEKIRSDPSYTPRVLCPMGENPDNTFTRYDLSPEDIYQIVEEAMQ